MDEAKKVVLLDLDALAPADKDVKLGGKVYKVAGKAPTEMMLRLLRLGQEITACNDNPGELAKVYEKTYGVYFELFKDTNKGLTLDKFRTIFDPVTHGAALSTFLSSQVDEAEKKTE